jgi:putative acyl-CoA dehydrogenase
MRNVLADLALEAEAALALSLRVARAVDAAAHGDTDESRHAAAFARIATAIGKYWICKRAPAFVNEAQECLGGNGYIEESILPRLYRQAPLNSIWEGSGNIQCLDVLRALAREPGTGAALLAELEGVRGMHAAMDAVIDPLRKAIAGDNAGEAGARLLVERLALALQAATLLRAGNPLAAAFCRSRLDGGHGLAFGTLPADERFEASIERVLPAA